VRIKLRNCSNDRLEQAVIIPVEASELGSIAKSRRFGFDWSDCAGEIFQVRMENTARTVGIVSLDVIDSELRVHINLLEVSKENVGREKIYDGVAGCLIAFACTLAFIEEFDGFVSLTPKTRLRKHYIEIYGFEEMGVNLFTDGGNSERLINKYLFHR
jgi:hypothetical protein